jgi:hypothetical protein
MRAIFTRAIHRCDAAGGTTSQLAEKVFGGIAFPTGDAQGKLVRSEVEMRGNDEQQGGVFSYVSAEQRIAADHPLRRIRTMRDEALHELSSEFDALFSRAARSLSGVEFT